ncbi:MAG: domain S-box [Marmoricola sp.]|nr:domain S-box [Marmoricola sp.]
MRNRPPPVLSSESDLERLFDLALDVLTVVGFDGYFKRVNPALARLLGYSSEELLSRPYLSFCHADDLRGSRELFADLLDADGEEIIGSENRFICADGSVRWLEWSTRVMPHEGLMYCVAKDVTDRRDAEAKLLEAYQLVEEDRDELRVLADEQAALRRVAALVGTGVLPVEVFAAVSDEVGRLFGTDSATVIKYDEDGAGISYVGSASKVSGVFPVGVHWKFQEGMASFDVYRTGRSARSGAHLITVDGPIGELHRRMGIVSAVASPIVVEGGLWGAMAVHGQATLPLDTEERLEKFTGLIATAIANVESRAGLARLAEEQAALSRVATLVARGVRADEIFAAVSDVVGRLVGTDSATVMKFDDEGPGIILVGVASKMSGAFPVGAHWKFQKGMASAQVYRTGRSARSDNQDWSKGEGPVAETHRQLGIVSAVASPIVVEGRLWGAMAVQSQEPLPLDTEERLEKFSGLVATAIANAESRAGVARLVEEQSALRRVATLVAEGLRPAELFSAVSEEVAGLFGSSAAVLRYDHDGPAIVFVGAVGVGIPIGTRWEFADGMASAEVYETHRSARVDSMDWAASGGPVAATARHIGVVSTVVSPILVEGRLWGAISLSSSEDLLPSDSEERMEQFTELVATAIANAEYRAELAASRQRIVAASDEARRRIERDLHDGIQQRLVSLGLELSLAESSVPTELKETRTAIKRVARGLGLSLDELQEVSRGIHPVILAEGGLGSALRTLARRSGVPVELRGRIRNRLPEPIEVAAYYIVSEALTNATKHAKASRVDIEVSAKGGSLTLSVRDDGIGGADPGLGSGLVGLADRVQALGGSIGVVSRPGDGTNITVELPLELTQDVDRRSGTSIPGTPDDEGRLPLQT